jgi:hypothetical protein|tara:strand:+ start:76 stop:324 length:249 start_codon:yes stop_codon:yes gene_type:complete
MSEERGLDYYRDALMQAYDGQKELERRIEKLWRYCLDNGVCPHCGQAQEDPGLRSWLDFARMCPPCEDRIYYGIEPNDNASG